MSKATLLFHHTHTPDSNEFEASVRNLDIRSHATDYVSITQALPPRFDAVFVKTDHWGTSPAYFSELEQRLNQMGSDLEWYDRCVRFSIGGSDALVVNGVETAVGTKRKHVTVVGLPLGDNDIYRCLSIKELVTLANRASWIAPAHIGMPFHRYSMSYLRRLISKLKENNVSIGIGYPTGYTPVYNRISRNDVPLLTSVRTLAERCDLSVVPELDSHAALPKALAGCGIIEKELDQAVDPGGSLTELLNVDLFRPPGYRCGINIRQFLANYSIFLPISSGHIDYRHRFRQSLPDSEQLMSVPVGASIISL